MSAPPRPALPSGPALSNPAPPPLDPGAPPGLGAAAADTPALARVWRGNLCAGCGACAALVPGRIAMVVPLPGERGAGFARPRQSGPVSAAQDAAIARVCPGLRQDVTDGAQAGAEFLHGTAQDGPGQGGLGQGGPGQGGPARNGAPDGVRDDPLWGPYRAMHTGWATDPEIRFAGSSGGALSMLLVHLLETGVVDAVVQTAADPENPVGNIAVPSTDRAGVLAAAGSRYAPSSPLAGLPAYLAAHRDHGRRHAFVGKPCDAAALRAMAARDPAVAAAFPVVLSFFCAGVPSLDAGRSLLAALGADPARTVRFRYRGNGWPGMATATLADGTERQMSYHDSWGRILSPRVQHRCKICADGTGVAADLVCADAWESDAAGYPLFTDAPGTSLIVARTAQGARILAAAVAAGRIETAPFDVARLAAIQPGQRDRRRGLLARLAALRWLGRPVPDYRGLRLLAAARQNPLRRNLQNFLGMLRRARRRSAPRPEPS